LDSQGTLHILTGDGEYAFWDGGAISTPLDLRPLLEQTEGARLAIVNGNQLLAVIGPFWNPGLYYTLKQLPVPALPTALPTTAPVMETASPTAVDQEPVSSGIPMATATVQNGHPFSAEETIPPTVPALLLSVGLSVVLVAVIVILQLGHRRR
jgi:hypothetical protein